MFKDTDIRNELSRLSGKTRNGGDLLVSEARKILKQDLFTERKILENLVKYNQSFELADEENLENDLIFTTTEIKETCIHYRLKFLDSKAFKAPIPYEAVLKIKHLNLKFDKDLKEFKVLAPPEPFAQKDSAAGGLLFVKTNYDNYYLVHAWGAKMKWHRKLKYWPLRYFENLFLTIIVTTFIITMSLPIGLITLDPRAGYWSGYRAAAFFHLLIFNTGVTAYITFTFTKNFSSSVWNREHDFD
ncbi:MAG: hypothetical protein V4635_01070 [Bacteroidota bacterium]